ncbi:MAG: 2-oxoacid:acceptor oxidoreductase family protein [Bacteroidales bacterium]|jgi:2-oxoglutarate ferredoxin oxidoreductase subunit gamma|nr:2-oxoacid:acceptor oxidoreductase family protein [Bacteroidales bacterium]
MTEEIIIAGFGGQGVLSMGKILAYSGIMQGMEVSWMPSYGPEMRGGTANVTVILSEEPVSSPVLSAFDVAIILNQQSMDKFEPMIKSGGVLLYDSNGIIRHPERKDIGVYCVEATVEASKTDPRIFNMMVLGGYLSIRPFLKPENVIEGLRKSLPERHHKLIPLNRQAISTGMELVKKIL